MSMDARNFHVPLPGDLYARLRDEAQAMGKPATAVAREAILRWLDARRRAALRESIEAYAEEHAGTDADLDRVMEAAAVDALSRGEDEGR
jgi:predicted DNA-binding protein